MADILPFKPYTHKCYRAPRLWGKRTVWSTTCPECEAHKKKLEAHMKASRARGYWMRRTLKEQR